MKKIAIVTINDFENIGNRLQNYALQKFLENQRVNVKTIRNFSKKVGILSRFKSIFGNFYKSLLRDKKSVRYTNFMKFNKNINFTFLGINKNNYSKKISNRFDYFIVGSDQVWNPNHGRLSDIDVLKGIESNKRISYAASFGVDSLSKSEEEKVKKEIEKFKCISVREIKGKEILSNILKDKDIFVNADPTLLLSQNEWCEIMKRPINMIKDRYVLNFFLGQKSGDTENKIYDFAKENNCKVIDMLDKKSDFYTCGPSEFIYLIKNAFMVFTDSFHATVFSIIFEKNFIVFDRVDSHKNMNSRIDYLLTLFDLAERKNNIDIYNFSQAIDYSKSKKIIENQKLNSIKYIRKALDFENEV